MQKKSIAALDDVADCMDTNDLWDAVCIQEVITDADQVGDLWVTTRQGHKAAVSRHFRRAHLTAILIHRKLIDYNETRHDLRVSSVALRAQAGHQGNLLRIQLRSVHMESAIGRDWDELDQTAARVQNLMKGKRFMKIIGADMNGKLIKTRSMETGIGTALRQYDKEVKDDEHHDALKLVVAEWNMRPTNMFEDWWTHVEDREREDGEYDYAETNCSRRNAAHTTPRRSRR